MRDDTTYAGGSRFILGAVRLLLRALDRAVFQPATPVAIQRRVVELAGLMGRAPRGTVFRSGTVNGVAGQWGYPPDTPTDAVLLYLHGGGYTVGSSRSHRLIAATVAKAAGTVCFLPDYRLAPEHPFPAASNDVLAVYEGLLSEGHAAERILLAGDSAGGGLALALAMTIRDCGLPRPAAVALICPWLDLTRAASERRASLSQPLLVTSAVLSRWADGYADAGAARQQEISPLYGELGGLPPLLMQSAGDDVLRDDADRLVERAARQGVPLSHRRYADLGHGFHMMTGVLPSAGAALVRLGEEISRHVAPRQRPPEVAIIGAGVSGLCLAAQLSGTDLADFTVYEKAPEIGGTWRDNHYPGLYCDVPSRLYSYTFAPDPSWSRLYASGAEIRRYLRKVAYDHGLTQRIELGTAVTGAVWDGAHWQLRTSAGPRTADVLVTATGFLHHPVMPDIPGLDRFTGTLFHSARWDASAAVEGQRVAVIGTGSSGTQIVSSLAGVVDHLSVFQRTAQWIVPIPNPRYSKIVQLVYQRCPGLNRLSRGVYQFTFELLTGAAALRPGPSRLVIAMACRLYLCLAVRDPDLRRRLWPKDRVMCKRLVASGSFYQALQRDGVMLVDSPIVEVTENGIRTQDGAFHQVDIIVLATGFDSHAFIRPLEVIGIGGVSLDKVWANGPYSYRSVALPGFPNFFMMIGPYSPIGNQSQLTTAETQAGYIIRWIEIIARRGSRVAVMPTAPATEDFLAEARAALRGTAWMSGCSSWYLDTAGTPILWPWTPRRHRQALRQPVLSDFELIVT